MADAKPKPKGSAGVATKIDWLAAKKYYLADSRVNAGMVAKKFGVSTTAVEKRASKEGWVALRAGLENLAFEEFQARLLNEKSKAQERHLETYQNLQHVAQVAIDAMVNGDIWLKDSKGRAVLNPKTEEPIKMPPDPHDLKSLVGAAKAAIEGERVVLGLPNNVTGVSDPDGKPLVAVPIYELKPRDAT